MQKSPSWKKESSGNFSAFKDIPGKQKNIGKKGCNIFLKNLLKIYIPIG